MFSEHHEAGELATFHRSLAEMCRACVPLPRALELADAELRRGPMRDAARRIREQVEAGRSFADAYAGAPNVFPSLYGRLVEAGERGGDLAGTLEQIADHAARADELRGRIRKALAYPLMTACAVLVLGLVALALASPTLWGYAEVVSGNTPLPIVAAALGVLVALVGFIAWLTWWRPRRRGELVGLPPGGSLRLLATRASLTSTLAMLLRRQLPLSEALELAADTASPDSVRSRVKAMARRAEEGRGLAASMRAGDLFEPSLMWLVETGEDAGTAADALDDLARIYQQRLGRGIDRFTVVLQPAAEIVVGAVVFVIAYSFLVPILQYTRRILWL